jgi:hypothetical protein
MLKTFSAITGTAARVINTCRFIRNSASQNRGNDVADVSGVAQSESFWEPTNVAHCSSTSLEDQVFILFWKEFINFLDIHL